jgi:hypothetical protein
MAFQRSLETFVNLPVASMSSDAGALDQLRVRTVKDASVVAGLVVHICQKAVAAFRLGLYDVVGSLVAVLHDGCKADATVVALCMADGRRAAKASIHGRSASSPLLDPVAAVMDLFGWLDELVVTSAKSATALVTAGPHVSAARGDLMEALQLLCAEEAVKLDLGAGLVDTLIRLLVRSVDYSGKLVAAPVASSVRSRVNHSEDRSAGDASARRRSLLAENELYRAAAGALINLIQHSKPNKDAALASLSGLLRVIECGEDYSVQVMCLEILFRLHFHNAAACREVIASAAGADESDGRAGSLSYLNDALRHLQSPVQSEILRTLEHVTQLLVTRRQEQQQLSAASMPSTTLHLDAVGVEVVTLGVASGNHDSTVGPSASGATEICTLAGPTMLHFNISFMVFRTMDNISHVTVPYTDVRSVRISRANKILISLHKVPDVIVEQLDAGSVPPLHAHLPVDDAARWGPLGIQVCVTAARIAQLRQSSVLDWIAASKSIAGGRSTVVATRSDAARPPHIVAVPEGSSRAASKRPRSTSNAATVDADLHVPHKQQQQRATSSSHPNATNRGMGRSTEDQPPAVDHAATSERIIEELQGRVQELVDGYRRDMGARRDALEATQRRALEDFAAHLKHVRHEARERVDVINLRMESLLSTWDSVREQELPKLAAAVDGYEGELKAVEVARVKELKVRVDASLGHLSDSMNRLVEQGEVYMLQRMKNGE